MPYMTNSSLTKATMYSINETQDSGGKLSMTALFKCDSVTVTAMGP